MKSSIGQTSADTKPPEAWWSYAAIVLAFGPLALLAVLMPTKIQLPAGYALGAVCTLLALGLLRARSMSFSSPSRKTPEAVASGEGANAYPTSLSAVPGRETLIAALSQDLKPSLPPTLLGVIRITNYDRMAAFDVKVADRFLSAFYQRLQDALGKRQRLALVERNCFAVWFGGSDDLQAAKAELQALGYALTQQIRGDTFAIEPELEIGSAETGTQPEPPAELISRALLSLTKPGLRGNGQKTASQGTMTDLRRQFALEQDLRQAIGNGELALHYQPFIDTAQMCVPGAEALLRWSHPKLGAISPVEFIPILEESGLMEDVGLWVLNTACRQLREWRTAGHPELKMAINLSARQLRDPELKNIIERTVQNHGLAPSCIEFELTETAAMEDLALTVELFGRLREAGFSLAIDDFGSGYSSMSYLKNLPFSKLKIDREFVSYIDQSSANGAICKALLELASGLGISALAEGVERREELDALARMGCTNFQGFYFAEPMEPGEFAAKTADSAWLAQLCSPAAGMRSELKRRYS